jgi:hypothetical protein
MTLPEDWLIKVVIVVALASAGAGAGWTVNGWRLNRQISELQTQEAKATASAEARHAADVDAARIREQALEALFQAEQAKRLQENNDYEKTLDYWRNRARTGADKLRVPVDAGSIPGCAASTDPAAIAGSGAEARADVLPAVADTVLGIAADDGRLVQDYNTVVRLYNTARDACNKPLGVPQ